MNRKQALETLLAKIEAGENWTAGTMEDLGLAAGFDLPDAASLIHAYRGSLDAALALHEAVLHGLDVDVDIRMVVSDVWVFRNMPSGETVHWIGTHESPARAWLMAILQALIAMEGE